MLRSTFLIGGSAAMTSRSTTAQGTPEPLARAHARLGVAVTRGLLLDLLATGETAAVDQAMHAFIDLYEGWITRTADG
jgi:hypothetical protein